MTDKTDVKWFTCSEGDCIGVQLAGDGKCLAHATTRSRNKTLKLFGETAEIDAEDVPLAVELRWRPER